MNKEALVQELGKIVGADRISDSEQAVLDAAKDYIGYRRYERDDKKYWVPRAACVVRPQSTEQVAEVLKYLNDKKIDVVPRTGGSSVTRGIEPQQDGVILDGSDMNEIIEVNEKDMYVTAKCGTPLEYLEGYLNKMGYTTGHFPQSLPLAQVGGLLATRSIGQFSTLYGGIEDLVVGLEAVLADGSVVRIKNVPRRSVGPDLRHLFIGSEGLLGFITEASLKIFKYMPENRWMKAYGIKGMKNGLALIRDIMVAGYKPAVVRLHDPLEVADQMGGVAPEGHCMLLLLAEGPAGVTKAIGEGIEALAAKYKPVDMGTKPVENWLVHRNDVCDDMDNPKYYDMGVVADTCEISGNWSEIGNIYDAVLERLPREMKNVVFLGGHSSHSYMQGTNIYFQFAFTAEGGAESVEKDYMNLIRIILEETLKRGGSIAHHHGSGKYRTQFMPQEHGSSYQLMYRLKEAMDPNHILNKGVLLVEEN